MMLFMMEMPTDLFTSTLLKFPHYATLIDFSDQAQLFFLVLRETLQNDLISFPDKIKR